MEIKYIQYNVLEIFVIHTIHLFLHIKRKKSRKKRSLTYMAVSVSPSATDQHNEP